MNDLLQLKGKLEMRSNNGKVGPKNLPKNGKVEATHILDLINQLQTIYDYWIDDNLIDGALVNVYYTKVVAKSNRITNLFVLKNSDNTNDTIRGAKFIGEGKEIKHIFTHYMSLQALKNSIVDLVYCYDIVKKQFNELITYDDINILNTTKNLNSDKLSRSKFINLIVDCFYVDKFKLDTETLDIDEQSIVSIYKTNIKTKDLLQKIGITVYDSNMLGETTVNLRPDQLKILKQKAPYLIAMETTDLKDICIENYREQETRKRFIPKPKNEPIVGVIDTLFDDNVYFNDWIDYERMISEDIPTGIDDTFHGTEVDSIIVDGPSLNPNLDDGCGRFRVKHFGVTTGKKFSSFTILKLINEIVIKNPNIKVWNLSLGSSLEINKNFISIEGAILDKIQCENDVIFVVAGTNRLNGEGVKRIGSPADSLNSLVVNSVNKYNKPASYYRVGPVLSFFNKPDVSYYGGDLEDGIIVSNAFSERKVSGTSFAAPWITRKLAYLIYKMGLSREVAKALIIDSAAGWDRKDDLTHSIGYGVVPIRIEDIIKSPKDEIRFFITGSTDKYQTYTYNLPVPTVEDKYPFYSKATLCYFPRCSRNQGVDYTDTEMDVKFGRVKENKNGSIEIKSINDNIQRNEGLNVLYEEDARKLYRKWDNVKHISEKIKDRKCPKIRYGESNWGLSVTTKERLTTHNDKELSFGVVVTLKEMNGVNRIEDFIRHCMVRGWIINRIEVENQIDIYNKALEEVEFE